MIDPSSHEEISSLKLIHVLLGQKQLKSSKEENPQQSRENHQESISRLISIEHEIPITNPLQISQIPLNFGNGNSLQSTTDLNPFKICIDQAFNQINFLQ